MSLPNFSDITWSDYTNTYTYTKTAADEGTHDVFGSNTMETLGFLKECVAIFGGICIPDNFTAMAWVYWIGETTTSITPYLDYGIIGNNALQLIIRVYSDGPKYHMSFSGTGGDLENGPIPTPNTWQHVAFVYDSPTQKIYLNGVLQATHTVSLDSYGLYPVNTKAYLGTWGYPEASPYDPSRNWQGNIAKITIFNKALDNIAINNYMNTYSYPTDVKHCCPKKPILDQSHYNHTLGQSASCVFKRVNQMQFSRNRYNIPLSLAVSQNTTTTFNLCNIITKLNTNIDISLNNNYASHAQRLNNSKTCKNLPKNKF
tara:strand:- start:441 stop:1385 length:945 start_codon:yes stop_codon:yes gene_type:complete